MQLVEFLSYVLKPESSAGFQQIMLTDSAPLHAAHGIDIVALGPSADNADHYILIRAFANAETRTRQLADFYAHPDWRLGPRAAIIAAIDHAIPVTRWLDRAAITALRNSPSAP